MGTSADQVFCSRQTGALRFANDLGELAQGAGLKEDGEFKVHLKGFLDFGNRGGRR